MDAIPITNHETWSVILWEGFDHLLCGPLRSWMLRHIEVNDAPAIMKENDEGEQNPKGRCWHREEINANDIIQVIFQESAPRLRGRRSMTNHVLVDSRLGDIVAK